MLCLKLISMDDFAVYMWKIYVELGQTLAILMLNDILKMNFHNGSNIM